MVLTARTSFVKFRGRPVNSEKTFSILYSKNPPLGISFEEDFSENSGNLPSSASLGSMLEHANTKSNHQTLGFYMHWLKIAILWFPHLPVVASIRCFNSL